MLMRKKNRDARDAKGTHETPKGRRDAKGMHEMPKGRRDAEDAEVAEP